MSRPLPETDESRLKSALRLEQQDELPKEVVDLYWRVERLSRIIRNSGVSDDGLIMVAAICGGGQPNVKTFIETAREIDRGTPVQALFKNEWVSGKYWGIKHNKILVCIDNDSVANREFGSTEVRLPTKSELELTGT
jgi:hypothetical protein